MWVYDAPCTARAGPQLLLQGAMRADVAVALAAALRVGYTESGRARP